LQHDPPAPAIVTLTTDFGTQDPYVGSMKGVMLSIEPRLTIVDISHELPPHQVLPAALLLREACPRFPESTVHVAVVDPGVGGNRRPLLLRAGDRFYLGPDNGLFSFLVRDFGLQGAWRLANPEYFLPAVSRTFHGRDIFAPAAAHLARGAPPPSFGPQIEDPVLIAMPAARTTQESLQGVVIWIDRFGNCLTNLSEELVSNWARGAPVLVHAASKRIGAISDCYDAAAAGEPLALFGSTGLLEIACNQARADRTLGLREGGPVTVWKERKQD